MLRKAPVIVTLCASFIAVAVIKKITQQKATVLFGKKMPLKENGTIRRYKVQHCWRKYVTVETGFLVPYMLNPCPVSQTISCLL